MMKNKIVSFDHIKTPEILVSPQIIKKQKEIAKLVTRSLPKMIKETGHALKPEDQNSANFIFTWIILENLYKMCKLKSNVIFVFDSSHKVVNSSNIKLFSIYYFDENKNRIMLVTGFMDEETKLLSDPVLRALLNSIKGLGLTLPPLDYVLTDTQKSFINSFREVFQNMYIYKKNIRWFYCILHVIEAVQKYLDQSGLQKN